MQKNNDLLMSIYQTGFAINDLTLYLDTHPDDEEALAYFHELSEKRADALKEFEAEQYPLVLDSVTESNSGDYWHWADAPAPWEADANVEL